MMMVIVQYYLIMKDKWSEPEQIFHCLEVNLPENRVLLLEEKKRSGTRRRLDLYTS